MNDFIKKAMARAIATRFAEGREVIDTPTEHRRVGPCPKCHATVETGSVTFVAEMSSAGLEKLLPQPDESERGLIVCHACLAPLMFTRHGTFEVIPKKVLRRLPEVSRRFIAWHQEWYRARNRKTN